jgi:hypothetical protein
VRVAGVRVEDVRVADVHVPGERAASARVASERIIYLIPFPIYEGRKRKLVIVKKSARLTCG